MLNFIRYIHQQILNRDEHNKSMSVIVGEDADVYGDVESEQREAPERQNESGKDPTFPGYVDGYVGYVGGGGGSHGHGDGGGYGDAGGGVRNANGGSMLTS